MAIDKPKTWLVTGANRGLGEAICRAALDAGHNVVATGRRPEELAKTFGTSSDRLLLLPLDVTDKGQIGTAISVIMDRFSVIDVLVNNAGYGLLGWFENLSEEQVRRQFDINFFGALDVTRAVLPVMRAQRSGHVFSISSIAGLRSNGGAAMYCASKFALEGWMEGLAEELAPLGIVATIIEPGFFRTDFLDESSADFAAYDIADYADAAKDRREFQRKMNHQQVGDPAKLGQMMLELNAMNAPPVRIAAGSDCSQWAEEKGQFIVDEAVRWRALSRATDGDSGIQVAQ